MPPAIYFVVEWLIINPTHLFGEEHIFSINSWHKIRISKYSFFVRAVKLCGKLLRRTLVLFQQCGTKHDM